MTALHMDLVLGRAEKIEAKVDGTAHGVEIDGLFIHTKPDQMEALEYALQLARRGQLAWTLSAGVLLREGDRQVQERKARRERIVDAYTAEIPLKGTIS